MGVEPTKARPGEIAFIGAFFVVSIFLLSQLGEQAKFSAKGKLFAQPAFWPAIGVIGMVLFTGLHLATRWRNRDKEGVGQELFLWLRAFEYVIWFMIYVNLAPLLGYLPSTILFTVLLALRMGYRRPATLLLAALSGFGIVLIFKTVLSVKIPGGAVYEYLPEAARNFMILNF